MERILVVDDEEGIRSFIEEVLTGEGLLVELAADGQAGLEIVERKSFHVMITDLKMPRLDGMQLLRRARQIAPEMEVIVLTAPGSGGSAVEAMKLGALDYLTKPLSGPEELRLVIERALERRRLSEHRQRVRRHEETAQLVTADPGMLGLIAQLRRVAKTPATVLLLGESGTGKEVAARMIHQESPRHEGPFVAVNCAAVSEQLVDSELFGHEKGAFTGATERRRGRFELADGGTLFLDEIAELPASLQAKLLRVLQERSFERVGGTRSIEVDVRVVAATNRDLGELMESGRFRRDLYHRLAVFPLSLGPLRERPGDVRPLAEHLLSRIGRQLGRMGLSVDEAALARLADHDWPGNVRELGNVLERAAILSDDGVIGVAHLALGSPSSEGPFDGTLQEIEKEAIRRALAMAGGHRKNAAARLGIGVRTLYAKLKTYGLD